MQTTNGGNDSRPIASLSLDLDNKWAYLRAAGRSDWETTSSYLGVVTDRMVDVLTELNLPLTVFLVGRDLQFESDVKAIESLRRLGTIEYANHSLNHLPWMHTMSAAKITSEILETHTRIETLFDERPIGFRGPGFSCPRQVLGVLAGLNYLYDASTFPTSMAPIARAVFLARTQLQGEQKRKAKQLYGGFAAMRKPNRPYQRTIEGQTLWEIPVTVMPLLRTPIHFSYFTFAASRSTRLAKLYFKSALQLCRWTGTTPSLLLHPPDFLGSEDDHEMAYFPGMKLPRAKKLALIQWALGYLARRFRVVTLAEQVRLLDPNAQMLASAAEPSGGSSRSHPKANVLSKTTGF